MRRVWAALLLLERYAAIRSAYVSFEPRMHWCKPRFPREGLGAGANVLSGDVRETNGLEVIANGNGVWEWGTALYVGKAGA